MGLIRHLLRRRSDVDATRIAKAVRGDLNQRLKKWRYCLWGELADESAREVLGLVGSNYELATRTLLAHVENAPGKRSDSAWWHDVYCVYDIADVLQYVVLVEDSEELFWRATVRLVVPVHVH